MQEIATHPAGASADFLPLNGTDYVEFYVGNAKQAAYFYRRVFGMRLTAYCGPETGAKDRVSYVLEQNKLRFVLTTSLDTKSSIAEHVHLHGDGVQNIALAVDDASSAYRETTKRGARGVIEPTVFKDEFGAVRLSAIATYGDTIHTFVERKNYRGAFLPGFAVVPGPDAVAEPAGLRRGDRRAWMRGDMIVPATQEKPPYWRVNRAENMLMLSSYHLSESAAPTYLDSLALFDPVVIQAYPSSIGFLATWMLSAGTRYRGISLRGIVTSSETLSDLRRREIESAFGCRVFDWYGQFERVAAIGSCEQGRHHLLSDYSYVEMLPADDGLFELVGTGFHNLSMPLIRYRCGDLVRPAPAKERCGCGRSFPLIEQVIGRVDDSIKLTDGRSIGRLDHLFKGVEGILEAQIRQDRVDAITFFIVPSSTFNDRTRETLQSNARYRLGGGIALEIRLVDAIPRTKNGKFKGVICNV